MRQCQHLKNTKIKKIHFNMERLDTTGWSKEKKEAYEQYLSKVTLQKELAKVMEKYLKDKKNKE